jgi:hypothetical protein
MRRFLAGVFVVLIIAAGGWMGSRVVAAWSRHGEIQLQIQEQESALEAARAKEKELREEIERAGREVTQAVDSLGANPTAMVMNRSFDIAKLQSVVEQDRLRAQRRLRHLGGEREKAAGDLRRWGVALAGVEAFLAGGLLLAWRYRPRRE